MAEPQDKASGAPETTPGAPSGAKPEAASEAAKAAVAPDLPAVDSPPLSPAADAPDSKPAPDSAPPVVVAEADKPADTGSVDDAAAAAPTRFRLRPRHRRYVMLATIAAVAASLGAVLGAVAAGGFAPTQRTDVAGLEERQAMRKSIAALDKQVVTLKAELARAGKTASGQFAKLESRLDTVAKSAAPPAAAPRPAAEDITGSIPPKAAGVPIPRPAPRIAAVESRPVVVPGWSIRDARNGYVYVQGHGDVYEVVPGAPLPGLGPVQSVRKEQGRWMVVTPRGIIVSQRDRRYFE